MGKFILAILARLLVEITPQLREKMQSSLDELDKKAKETASPIDDIFVGLLKVLCGVE